MPGYPNCCRPLTDVVEAVEAVRRERPWGADKRRAACAADAALAAKNAAAVAAAAESGEPVAGLVHQYSKLYLPHHGMFADAPADLQLGTRLPVRPAPDHPTAAFPSPRCPLLRPLFPSGPSSLQAIAAMQ